MAISSNSKPRHEVIQNLLRRFVDPTTQEAIGFEFSDVRRLNPNLSRQQVWYHVNKLVEETFLTIDPYASQYTITDVSRLEQELARSGPNDFQGALLPEDQASLLAKNEIERLNEIAYYIAAWRSLKLPETDRAVAKMNGAVGRLMQDLQALQIYMKTHRLPRKLATKIIYSDYAYAENGIKSLSPNPDIALDLFHSMLPPDSSPQ